MRESVGIVFDGVEMLKENGVQINDEGGLFSETFVATKSIKEERVRGNDVPYFFGIEREPLSFSLAFYFDEELSDERKRHIARILDQDVYKPMYAVDNPHRIYYAMCIDDSTHIHNGIQMGYVKLNFRTNAPFAFSPVYFDNHDFSDNTEKGIEITFENHGDYECKPILEVHMLEDGNFSIINFSNEGQEVKFTNLKKDEVITVDCIKEYVKSNINDLPFENFNDVYLSFVRGYNYLNVKGKCILNFRYQFNFK
jgi:phage-related protein